MSEVTAAVWRVRGKQVGMATTVSELVLMKMSGVFTVNVLVVIV